MKLLIICILMCILLVGCKPQIEYINVTHTINNTIYIEKEVKVEVIKYINITEPCEYNETTSPKYFLSLIQQIKRCEAQLARDWNITECEWEIQKLNHSLNECNESLKAIKELLE